MSKSRAVTVRAFESFAQIAPYWARLGPFDDIPFLRAEWLSALEETGCAVADRGWVPHHLAFFEDDEILCAAPAYLKLHSEGEFVFDYAWANAARKFKVSYYPKLLVASPFTPATGPRVLVAEGKDRALALSAFAAGIETIAEQAKLSSSHVLFLPEDEAEALSSFGLVHRSGVQFHWTNGGYQTFEDFLGSLPSKRRTQIRRERRGPAEQGLTLSSLSGKELTPELADTMYELYLTTVDKFMWGRRYLTRSFFEAVFASMPESLEVVLARDEGKKAIAGAFNLLGKTARFGRYWGAYEEVPFLHFNVCFYHSIERSILEGRTRFEPGAGGEHKLARGFAPTLTHSVHTVTEPRFRAAIADFCTRERELLREELGS
jgi:predicted N-acyltransferase